MRQYVGVEDWPEDNDQALCFLDRAYFHLRNQESGSFAKNLAARAIINQAANRVLEKRA